VRQLPTSIPRPGGNIAHRMANARPPLYAGTMKSCRHRSFSLLSIQALALLLVVWSFAPLHAQPGTGQWELNLHAAAMRPGLFDESSEAWQFGGRIARNFGNGLFLGASFDRASSQNVTLTPFGELGASLLLYSADLGYQVYMSPRSVFLIGAGAGAATLQINDAPPGVARSSTGLLVPFGAGMKFQNRAVAPSWAFRFDVRDNVILLDRESSDGGMETEPRHNPEVSLGLSFLFGSGETPPEERDTDRDGVPDPLDHCLNRPDQAVDARGCPIRPEAPPPIDEEAIAAPDEDGDGIPDDVDGCLGTLAGMPVKADGCPIPPDPSAPAAARPGDEDGDGVPDDRDECPGTRAGVPIDDRGCLARIEPAAEPDDEDAAPGLAEPVEPIPEAAEPGLACNDTEGLTIEFEGRRFEALGFPQQVDRRFLVPAGTFEGIPIYVSDTAQRPYADLWVPRCDGDQMFELYVESGEAP